MPEYHNPDVRFTYYLMIPHADPKNFRLLMQKNGEQWTLPVYHPEEHHFAAIKHINDYLWRTYGIYAATLRCLGTNFDEATGERRFYVMDNLYAEWQKPDDMEWLTEDEVKADTSIAPLQREMIAHWFNWRHSDNSLRVSWMRPGWFSDAAYWMVDLADRMDMGGIQTVEQVRLWSRSCTMRLDTDDGVLYMKAVPEMLSYEPVITRVLALRYPGFMPDVRAVHVENGWMFMRDFGGERLTDIKDLDVWKRVLKNYADIQIDLVGSVQSLVALGVPDRNVDYLSSQIDRLMVSLPKELSEEEQKEMRRLAPTLKNMCFELLEHRIPLTLTHGDLWSGNVIIKPDGTNLFFDWSDASVSHPFFDLPFFLAEIARELPNSPMAKAALLDVYFDAWTRYEPKAMLRQAYALAEVLGNLHQALFYHTNILPGIEADARWEMQNMLPILLRQVLAAARFFQR